jgi:vacuolar-type H+-ATPase subunit C/Vma6
VFDTGGPEAAAFARAAQRTAEARRDLFKRLSMDPIELRTDRAYLPALTTFFESRARRLRH